MIDISFEDLSQTEAGPYVGSQPVNGLIAQNGYEINGDAWLSNVKQNTVGTFGFGYGSPLWSETD